MVLFSLYQRRVYSNSLLQNLAHALARNSDLAADFRLGQTLALKLEDSLLLLV